MISHVAMFHEDACVNNKYYSVGSLPSLKSDWQWNKNGRRWSTSTGKHVKKQWVQNRRIGKNSRYTIPCIIFSNYSFFNDAFLVLIGVSFSLFPKASVCICSDTGSVPNRHWAITQINNDIGLIQVHVLPDIYIETMSMDINPSHTT